MTRTQRTAILFTLTLGAAFGQRPEFEIASVKPVEPRGRVALTVDPARIVANNADLKTLIVWAYGIDVNYLLGGPAWIDSMNARYTIEAKAAHPTTKDQLLLMLQALLADRFKLTLHREKKDLPVYLLVVGKTGSKLREVEAAENPQVAFAMVGQNMRLTGRHAPIDRLTTWLSAVLMSDNRLVLNRTGLTGVYDFQMEWLPDQGAPAEIGVASDPTGSSIYTAVQQQLGLKLEPQKEQVEILVIDHAEKPSEN